MNKRIQLITILVIFLFSIQLLIFESYQTIFPNPDENNNYYLDETEISENNDDEDNTKYTKEDPPNKRSLESYNSGKTTIQNEMEERTQYSQNQSSHSSISIKIPNSSNFSSINLDTLDQNQLVDVISLKVSQAHNIEEYKIKQVLIDLIKITQTKNGDVLKSLRQ